MSQSPAGDDQKRRASLAAVSPGAGFRAGLAAFGCSFLVLAVIAALEVTVSDPGFRGFRGEDGWRILVALVAGNFYSIHLGAHTVAQVETLLSIYGTVSDAVFLPIVVTILWAFGYRTVVRTGVQFDLTSGAVQGSAVAIGYAVGTVVSLAVVVVLLGPDASLFTSEAVNVVVVAGIGYPVVCGAGGGVAATLGQREPARE